MKSDALTSFECSSNQKKQQTIKNKITTLADKGFSIILLFGNFYFIL